MAWFCVCGTTAAVELVFVVRVFDFSLDRDRREYGDLQRGRCVAAAAATVSAAGSIGGSVAAFAGDWDFSGLAVPGAICRFEERESLVRTDGAGADTSCDADGAGAAGTSRRDKGAVDAADDARWEGAARAS